MQLTSEGSVRVDLLGGTLDLEPINLVIPNVVTLNVATSLQAKVEIEDHSEDYIEIQSLDYEKNYRFSLESITKDNLYRHQKFAEMNFILQILDHFDALVPLKIKLSSGSPAGSGLGGSSAMGMTLYKAIAKWKGLKFDTNEAVAQIKGVEARILNQGVTGYQDYYPAMTGGVLALHPKAGRVEVEQLYSDELVNVLEQNITLVYSGVSRDSGINNWQMYKNFFDGVAKTKKALTGIADISYQSYTAIKEKKYDELLTLIGQEGELRKELASGIVPMEIQRFYDELAKTKLVTGMKMCGAGGGGCFIVTHKPEDKISLAETLEMSAMRVLDFKIVPPLN